ncbi:MAG TPA: TIGR03086 family metal-binding protein [Propionibacteriaceae bacterium]|nr:TIGR03086 family metal-binding protein [Propionibacteriaceae bacterium]
MALETTYRRSVEYWKATVQSAPGDWSGPTPCTDWDVRTLVNHVVGEDRWTKPLVDGKTIAEVGDTLDGDLLGEDPKAIARAAADEALTAVAERLPAGGKVHLSYGEEDIEEYIRQLVADHLIHGWDLAVATGQHRSLDPELVAEVAAWFRDREAIYRKGGSIAERPTSAKSGDPQSDLLIAFGRNPDWAP